MHNRGVIKLDELSRPKKMLEELLQYYWLLYSEEEHEEHVAGGTNLAGLEERVNQIQLFTDLLSCDTYEEEWTQIVNGNNNNNKSKKKREQKKKRKNKTKR
jgi:hypothetical protein